MKADGEMTKTTTSTSTLKKMKPLSRDEQAKVSEACLKHGALVKQIATEYVRPGSGLDLEDLMQLGYVAIVAAVREWNPDGGSSFVTIANLRIRDALRTAVGARQKHKDPIRKSISIDEPYDDGEPLRDLIGEDATQEDDYSNKELHEKIIKKLSPADQALLSRVAQGARDPEIAQEIGKPRSTIQGNKKQATARFLQVAGQIEPNVLDRFSTRKAA